MRTTDYKKGDVVLLIDGGRYKRFEYLGEVPVHGITVNAYKPLDGKTKYAIVKDAAGEFVPFNNKQALEVVGLKWYEKVLQWWKASNRWKHFLFAIPLGAVCGAPFTTGVGLGMEVKDHLYGNRADFVDFLLTAVGGVIGHGVMLAVGLDYVIGFLISLIF
ncbi:hypothetical protein BK687P3_00020 [Bacteroides phage BK687P3]|nr:hypothetical protein BK687P3_00020 [Bacteroides phage BK687P3]